MELVRKEEPVKRVDGGTLGKGIASLFLAYNAISSGLSAIALLLIFTLLGRLDYQFYESLGDAYIGVLANAFIGLASGIICKILSTQAQNSPGQRHLPLRKASAITSTIALIISIICAVISVLGGSVVGIFV